MKILVCMLKTHGDIIRTFPMIDSLKNKYPNSYIAFTCFEEMLDVVKLCKSIDEIIIQPRLEVVENHFKNTRICDVQVLEYVVQYIKKSNFDIYIDLHGIFQSGIIGMLSEISIRLGRSKITAKDGAYLFYNKIANIEDKFINKMERHFIVANAYFKNIRPCISNLNYKNNNKILIVPGSSKNGIVKRWNKEKYKKIAILYSKYYNVEIVIGPEELELYEYFSKENKYNVTIIKKWSEYEKKLKNVKFVIGNDSAVLHMAIWKGIPTFMICGPTSSKINSVWKYGKGCGITSEEKCKCIDVWNCYNHNDCKCLESISVNSVYNIINKYIENL